MLILIMALIWLHFIGDFIFQTDKMAVNKSKSIEYLTYHVLAYSVPFFALCFHFALLDVLYFVGLNMVLHWAVDFVTSKITASLWAANKRHEFFVVIGLDQAIHFTCLLMTSYILFFNRIIADVISRL